MTTRTLDRIAAISAIPMTGIVLGAAVLLPFIVHLIPPVNGTPVGSWLLPIFYAPLLAVILLRRPVIAVIAALLAPMANYLILGMPTLPIAVVLTLELATFCGALALVTNRWHGFWGAVLIAYLFAKVASLVLLFIYPIIPTSPLTYAVSSTMTALPGIVLMLALSFAATRYISSG